MAKIVEGDLTAGRKIAIGIVVARYNDAITKRLLEGALEGLRRHGVGDNDITVAWVPGSFEVPLAAEEMASSKRFDALICLGCVIRGETRHFEYVAGEAASGIAKVSLEHRLPVVYAVLATENVDQAMERAGLKLNRGREAAEEAIEMANLMHALREELGTG